MVVQRNSMSCSCKGASRLLPLNSVAEFHCRRKRSRHLSHWVHHVGTLISVTFLCRCIHFFKFLTTNLHRISLAARSFGSVFQRLRSRVSLAAGTKYFSSAASSLFSPKLDEKYAFVASSSSFWRSTNTFYGAYARLPPLKTSFINRASRIINKRSLSRFWDRYAFSWFEYQRKRHCTDF